MFYICLHTESLCFFFRIYMYIFMYMDTDIYRFLFAYSYTYTYTFSNSFTCAYSNSNSFVYEYFYKYITDRSKGPWSRESIDTIFCVPAIHRNPTHTHTFTLIVCYGRPSKCVPWLNAADFSWY